MFLRLSETHGRKGLNTLDCIGTSCIKGLSNEIEEQYFSINSLESNTKE